MLHFCTIVTESHISYAQALDASLAQVLPAHKLHVLVVDSNIEKKVSDSIVLVSLDGINSNLMDKLKVKYLDTGKTDEFRWSMKSVLLSHLLKEHEKVVFVDPDIAFYDDPSFLFEDLDEFQVLLTPHWRCHLPSEDPSNFFVLQTSGLFNAGFVGVSKGAEEMLGWWGDLCLYKCEVSTKKGMFVDQAYLDMVPVYFENVGIVRHRGCNLAAWNRTLNKRVDVENSVLINGIDSIVFVHFTNSTVKLILNGTDKNLGLHLDRWIEWLGVDSVQFKAKFEDKYSFKQIIFQYLRSIRHFIYKIINLIRR